MNTNRHPADLPVAIILIVLNALGACGGLMLVLGGGILGAAGASGGAAAGSAGGAAGAAVVGGGIAFLGIIVAAICALSIFGAIGMIQGKRVGFLITAVLGAIGLVLNIISFNILGIVLSAAQAAFGFLRLNGTLPPKPE